MKNAQLMILFSALLTVLFLSNFSQSSIVFSASKEAKMSAINQFVLDSPAFKPGQTIPKQYTADGADMSPPLSWTTAPAGTQSFALICEDPDAPMGTWIHWLIYDIPASQTHLAQAVPTQPQLADGTKQGISSFHRIGYGGPSPPPGSPHRYFFKLYALSSMSGFEPGIDLKKFRQLVETHKLGEAQIMGTYGR